jgi:prepilin-type N-terminal cleavage/methylation domain-containing protein
MKNLQKAFTLVELLVVIIILTILATIGFVSLSGYTQNTRDSVRLSDLSSATKQLIIYQTKNNSLPIPQDVKNVIFSD